MLILLLITKFVCQNSNLQVNLTGVANITPVDTCSSNHVNCTSADGEFIFEQLSNLLENGTYTACNLPEVMLWALRLFCFVEIQERYLLFNFAFQYFVYSWIMTMVACAAFVRLNYLLKTGLLLAMLGLYIILIFLLVSLLYSPYRQCIMYE